MTDITRQMLKKDILELKERLGPDVAKLCLMFFLKGYMAAQGILQDNQETFNSLLENFK